MGGQHKNAGIRKKAFGGIACRVIRLTMTASGGCRVAKHTRHAYNSFMGKAAVDPAELRRFAADLNRFNNELQGLVASLHGKMRALEQTWRDQEQRKFAEAFEQTAKGLSSFLEASHAHVQFLGKKATLIEEYLKQR
jgi:uncharacterized protein YukE